MKIGIEASLNDKNGYGRWGEYTYKKLREHGYSCSYYNMSDTDSAIYTLAQRESDDLLLHERNLADFAGIAIDQVHGPWRFPPDDSTVQAREERMKKMRTSIRATALLGCKNWVVHPLMPCGVSDAGTDDAKTTWDVNLGFMKELLKTAKQYDVTICLENMPFSKFSLSKPADILKFTKEINDENFAICFDTGHVSVFDDLNVSQELRSLRNEIRVLHVHDNTRGMDLHMMPFFGIIDWSDFASALKDIQFGGCFTLETLPSRKLPTDVFEDMCKSLAQIAKQIVSYI